MTKREPGSEFHGTTFETRAERAEREAGRTKKIAENKPVAFGKERG